MTEQTPQHLSPPPPAVPAPADPEAAARAGREVVALHRFFADWFAGRLPDEAAAFSRLADALAPGFELVSPGGETLAREELLEGLRRAHGRDPRAIEVDLVGAHGVGPGLWLVGYREWQRVADGAWRGRRSTALLREEPGGTPPFRWLHVHETWLPEGTARDAR